MLGPEGTGEVEINVSVISAPNVGSVPIEATYGLLSSLNVKAAWNPHRFTHPYLFFGIKFHTKKLMCIK